jgi:hypothetical protein
LSIQAQTAAGIWGESNTLFALDPDIFRRGSSSEEKTGSVRQFRDSGQYLTEF